MVMPFSLESTNLYFSSQVACSDFAKSLWSIRGPRIISPKSEAFEGNDTYDILVDLFKRHPTWDGIIPIKFKTALGDWREQAWYYQTQGLSWVNFSMKKCVTGLDTTEHAKRMVILRELIAPQVMKIPKKCFYGCQDFYVEIDHVWPFADMVIEFMKGKTYPEIESIGSRNIFKDRGFCDSWIEYHEDNAWLMPLCKTHHDEKTHGD